MTKFSLLFQPTRSNYEELRRLQLSSFPSFRARDLQTSRLKVRELTFSPCSRFLASHSGNTIQLWDVDTETDSLRLRHTLDGHLDHLWGPLSFSPNGQLLATSSSDHMLTFRNTRTGSLWLPLGYQPSCFMIHGSVLVLGYGSGRVLFITSVLSGIVNEVRWESLMPCCFFAC